MTITMYSAHAIADAAAAAYDAAVGNTDSEVRACVGVEGRYSAFGLFTGGSDPIITIEETEAGVYRVCDYSTCVDDLSGEQAHATAGDLAALFGKEAAKIA